MKLITVNKSVGGLLWTAVLLLQVCCNAEAADRLLLGAASCSSVCRLDKRSALCTQCISREPLRFGKRFTEIVELRSVDNLRKSNSKHKRMLNELIQQDLLHLRRPEITFMKEEVSQDDDRRNPGSAYLFLFPYAKLKGDDPNHRGRHWEVNGEEKISVTKPERAPLRASDPEMEIAKKSYPAMLDDDDHDTDRKRGKMNFWKEFEARW